jgi:hypothetical protein
MYPTQALFRGVARAPRGRECVRNQFVDSRWPGADILHQPVEVLKEGVGVGGETNAGAITCLKGIL